MSLTLDRPVVVLFGGTSSERRVSVASAQTVIRSLLGHARVRACFWTPDDHLVEVTPADVLAHGRPFELDFLPEGRDLGHLPGAFRAFHPRDVVFFVALHGLRAEDGELQAWLEAQHLAFTGSGAAASGLAFDKRQTKQAVASRGVVVAQGIELHSGDASGFEQGLRSVLQRHGEVVLKPVADGSSAGVYFVRDETTLAAAVERAIAMPRAYLAEQRVQGRELTVGVWHDGHSLRALPCSEVRLAPGRTFDYDGKYLGQGSTEITPAEISEDETLEAQRMALAAHRALGCEGYSRTDMILTERGPVFLELNTLPGLSSASFIPQQLEAADIPLLRFFLAQLELGIVRCEGALPHEDEPTVAR